MKSKAQIEKDYPVKYDGTINVGEFVAVLVSEPGVSAWFGKGEWYEGVIFDKVRYRKGYRYTLSTVDNQGKNIDLAFTESQMVMLRKEARA